MPLGLRVLRKIEQIIREEMDAIGGQEVLMSTLAPKELWEKTGRLETVDVLMKAVAANKASSLKHDADYVISPTHEEMITPLAQSYLLSYKDLPALPYQIQNKFRNEPRARAGLLRTREFPMKDLYSFHADDAGFTSFYNVAAGAYKKVFERLGLGHLTYFTVASGGDFTKKHSHEFQTVMPGGEDTIYLLNICQNCKSEFGAGLAYNKEVVLPDSSSFKCEQCSQNNFTVEKACEVGNIFPLETRFSEAFNFKYVDEAGQPQFPVMGSYGIGPSRVMGVLAEVFADDKGVAWPEVVAPFKVQLIDLDSGRAARSGGSTGVADDVYKGLTSVGIEVLFDDRDDVSAGEKFAEADLIGCPWQVLVSKKSLAAGGVEVRKRGEKQGKIVAINDLTNRFN